MDLIANILNRLEIDQTIFIQFGIAVFLYVVLDRIFFRKVLYVLELTYAKTEGLREKADEKMAYADDLALGYKEKLDKVYVEAQEKYNIEAKEIIDTNHKEIAKFQIELEEEEEEKRKAYQNKLLKARDDIFDKAESLSNDFVNKLAQ